MRLHSRQIPDSSSLGVALFHLWLILKVLRFFAHNMMSATRLERRVGPSQGDIEKQRRVETTMVQLIFRALSPNQPHNHTTALPIS